MSTGAWIAGEAGRPLGRIPAGATPKSRAELTNKVALRQQETQAVSGKDHAAGVGKSAREMVNAAWASCEQERERRIYRARTVAMLRRYMRYSIETGRMPSLVGREFFRSKITKYQMATFEDRVIFVHDMERCLEQLDDFGRQVLGRIVLQEYGQEDAARLLGCTRMTVHRKLLESLDQLSDILISVDLLDALTANGSKPVKGAKRTIFC